MTASTTHTVQATPATGPRLNIDRLRKCYGARAALDGLSLQLQAGCFTALLGPNGAGKSTLFQVLTGLFAADAGEVWVNGHSLRGSAVAALHHIGVVFQSMSLDLDLSVERNLRFHADLHGLPRALARQRISADCAAAGLSADLQLWATHLVEEAEAADRVLVLHKGKLLADGTPAAVASALGGGTLEEAFIRATA